jgi:uncharacterized small protein (DUF1192 family)
LPDDFVCGGEGDEMREPFHGDRVAIVNELGDSLAQRTTARCIRELARDIDDLNHRIAALDQEIAVLLAEHGNPSRTSRAPAPTAPP